MTLGERQIREKIEDRLPWLIHDLGFRILYAERHSGMGWAWSATLESDSMRLNLRYSGGRFYPQVASLDEPQNWMELGPLWNELSGTLPDPELEGWAYFVRDHLAELSRALGPEYADTKARWERQRENVRLSIAPYVRKRGLEKIFQPQVIPRIRRILKWGAVALFTWIILCLIEMK
jgi:hypothetical protein